jgi:hypothetical protein
MVVLEIRVHSLLLFFWALPHAKVSNDLLSRSVSSRSSGKGLSSASAIHSIIRKDGLPLPLVKTEINDLDTLVIFESCSFVPPSHQVFEGYWSRICGYALTTY